MNIQNKHTCGNLYGSPGNWVYDESCGRCQENRRRWLAATATEDELSMTWYEPNDFSKKPNLSQIEGDEEFD